MPCAERIRVVEGHGVLGHERVIDDPEGLGSGWVGYLTGHPDTEVMLAARSDVRVPADASGKSTFISAAAGLLTPTAGLHEVAEARRGARSSTGSLHCCHRRRP